jgi:hypothetical protein
MTDTTHQEPRTGQAPDATIDPAASRLVAACEHAWRTIQTRHPRVPDTVIVLGTGVEHGRLVKLGHWWGGQWHVGSQARGEVLLAGEALHLPPEAVFEVLLHEAAHGLNAGRAVRDTSRGGRYHNTRFKEAAAEVGLRPRRMDPYGWARTELTPATREVYAEAIARVGAEMRLARGLPARRGVGLEGGTGLTGDEAPPIERGGREQRPKQRPAECGCEPPRKLRMAPSVLARGPVICALCSEPFELDRAPEARPVPGDERAAASGVVDDSFLARRRQDLRADVPVVDVVDGARAYLNRIEAVFAQAAPQLDQGDLILQVFRQAKPDIAQWFEDVVTAEVVPLPGATALEPHRAGHGLDRHPPTADPAPARTPPPPPLVPEPPLPELRP